EAHSRVIVGWRVAAPNAHRHGSRRGGDGSLVARRDVDRPAVYSNAGSQFTSIRYGERLAEIGAVPSIGTVGDSFDRSGRDSDRLLNKRTHPWIRPTGAVENR